MPVKIAALADYASISQEGKLNILGIFGQINASQAPCVHLQMAVVVQFEFQPEEAGRHALGLQLLDEDGRLLLSIDGVGDVPNSPNAEPIVVNQIITLPPVTFPRFGQYEFKVILDGYPVATIPVRVARATNPNQIGI